MSKMTIDVPTVAVPFDLSAGRDVDFYRRVEKITDYEENGHCGA